MKIEAKLNHTASIGTFSKTLYFNGFIVLLLLLVCAGCLSLISDYDSYTYKNLTELKGEMRVAFEEFVRHLRKSVANFPKNFGQFRTMTMQDIFGSCEVVSCIDVKDE